MWKVVTDSNFKNASLIFPTQQRDVAVILKKAAKIPEIKKAVVFGSSVTSACNPWSDIDIYFELTQPLNALDVVSPEIGVPVDKWTNYDVDERLLKEINEKGVVVYEK